jgi:hypothetical protein
MEIDVRVGFSCALLRIGMARQNILLVIGTWKPKKSKNDAS